MSTDPQSLLASANCFLCVGVSLEDAMELALLAQVIAPRTRDLDAWWKFDEGSGIVAKDSSGNGNTATLVGGPAWSADGLTFSGPQYATVVDSSSLKIVGPITICFWLKTSQVSGPVIFGAFDGNPPYDGYGAGMGVLTNGRIGYWSGVAGAWSEGNTAVNDNQWHHCAIVVSGTAATFYLDGNADGTKTTAQPNSFTGQRNIASNTDNADFFSGSLDDIRIFSAALSGFEVRNIYHDRE